MTMNPMVKLTLIWHLIHIQLYYFFHRKIHKRCVGSKQTSVVHLTIQCIPIQLFMLYYTYISRTYNISSLCLVFTLHTCKLHTCTPWPSMTRNSQQARYMHPALAIRTPRNKCN